MLQTQRPEEILDQNRPEQTIVAIENIEDRRLQEGIDDFELRAAIRGLRVGDYVRVTFLGGTHAFETLLVRITRSTGLRFQGRLAEKPVSKSLASVTLGMPIHFAAAEIHSIPSKRPNPKVAN